MRRTEKCPTLAAVTSGDKVTIAVTLNDIDSNVTKVGVQIVGLNGYILYDTSTTTNGKTSFQVTVTDSIGTITPGTYTVNIFLMDASGNSSNYVSSSFTVQASSGTPAPAPAPTPTPTPTPTPNSLVGTWKLGTRTFTLNSNGSYTGIDSRNNSVGTGTYSTNNGQFTITDTGGESSCISSSPSGTYSYTMGDNGSSFTLIKINDNCTGRAGVFNGSTFTKI